MASTIDEMRPFTLFNADERTEINRLIDLLIGGSGRVSFGMEQQTIPLDGPEQSDRELESRVVCYCGGLGWLLQNE